MPVGLSLRICFLELSSAGNTVDKVHNPLHSTVVKLLCTSYIHPSIHYLYLLSFKGLSQSQLKCGEKLDTPALACRGLTHRNNHLHSHSHLQTITLTPTCRSLDCGKELECLEKQTGGEHVRSNWSLMSTIGCFAWCYLHDYSSTAADLQCLSVKLKTTGVEPKCFTVTAKEKQHKHGWKEWFNDRIQHSTREKCHKRNRRT